MLAQGYSYSENFLRTIAIGLEFSAGSAATLSFEYFLSNITNDTTLNFILERGFPNAVVGGPAFAALATILKYTFKFWEANLNITFIEFCKQHARDLGVFFLSAWGVAGAAFVGYSTAAELLQKLGVIKSLGIAYATGMTIFSLGNFIPTMRSPLLDFLLPTIC